MADGDDGIRGRRRAARRSGRLRSLSEFDERDRLPELDWKKITRAGGARRRRMSEPPRRCRRRMAKLRLGVRRWLARLRING